MKLSTLVLAFVAAVAQAKLLIDYHGGDPPSELGIAELEGQELGDHIALEDGGNNVFIRGELDKHTGLPCLHYKRAPHFRRAEVRALQGQLTTGKTYYIGYKVRLSKAHDSLVIFQWKKEDKFAAPEQNIPFHLEFIGGDETTTNLTLAYTTPGGNGSNRNAVWSGQFSTGSSKSEIHHIGLAINTANDGSGWLKLWLDGKQQKFNGKSKLSNVFLYTGETFPKFGLYRGEAAPGSKDPAWEHTFNSYVYRVQFSDKSIDEVAEAAGL